MATKIVTKNSSTASAVPTASDLVQGELAVNVADKRLFTEDNGGAIVELGTNPYNFTANYNGSAKLATTSTGIDVTGDIVLGDANPSITLNDSSIANLQHVINSVSNKLQISTDPNGVHSSSRIEFLVDNTEHLQVTSAGIDVTGTATMDGLTVDGESDLNATLTITHANPRIKFIENDSVNSNTQFSNDAGDFAISTMNDAENVFTKRFNLDHATGDISFYEDTGTTPKLFWDASAESLGIGTSSPDKALTISASDSQVRLYDADGTNQFASFQSDNGITKITSRNNTSHGQIAFQTYNGTAVSERMRIDSSGNVGIGTSTIVDSKLHLKTTSSTNLRIEGGDPNSKNIVFVKNTGGTQQAKITATGENLYFTTGTTHERLRIDSSGNVGIGTDSPSEKLQVDGNIRLGPAHTTRIGTDGTNAYFENFANGAVIFRNNGYTERARIDSSGNLLVGTTDSSPWGNSAANADDNGVVATSDGIISSARYNNTPALFNRTGNDGTVVSVRKNGTEVGSISVTASATAYNTSSDQRLKENIADADDAGSKIDAIQVRKYDWKADGSHQDYGMIAQELQTVAPEAVSGDADSEEMMGVDYSKLVPMLIKEIQSLRNRVAQLEE